MIMKILKKGGGGSREKGEEETKSLPHAPVVLSLESSIKKKINKHEKSDK